MRKGITPLIAMILLILIVIVLAGAFLAWTTRTFETVSEAGSESIEKTGESFSKTMRIDNIDCNGGSIYVRNTGAGELRCNDLSVYVDDSSATYSCAFSTINPGSVGEITITTPASISGSRVKVTLSGNSDRYNC